jgi:pyruvate kinase
MAAMDEPDAPSAPPSARGTKLICTIGPATAPRVRELVAAGMDVARLNFSHGTAASRTAAARAVRTASATADRPVGILADLAGPKIRLGPLPDGAVTLHAGDAFRLTPVGHRDRPARHAEPGGAAVAYRRLAGDVRPGDRILLADGAAELRVTGVDAVVDTEVVRGGTIRSRQGVSIPSERLSTPPLTRRDRESLPAIAAIGADLVAQSFVRRAGDIRELRTALGSDGPPIIAKIETRSAVDDFDAILDVVDAVMVARGDLGVELPYEEVPIVQKQLVRRCLDRGVPVVVATQMLESMIDAPR